MQLRPLPLALPFSALRALGWVVLALTVVFALVLVPFSGAICWAIFIAVVFIPVQRRLTRRLRGHATVAALLTLLLIVLIVILPLSLLGVSITQEVAAFVARLRSGNVDIGAYFRQIHAVMPAWAQSLLERLGVGTFADLQQELTTALSESARAIPVRVFNAGQLTLNWVLSFFLMLYLLFFLLRDGDDVAREIVAAIPLADKHKQLLALRFVQAIRATIRGNIVVALVQGFLGGLAFWVLGISGPLLWGTVMAVLSLLPSIGAALVWGPVAIYLFANGMLWQGVALALWGSLAIGLVDNLLRPSLVGKDIHLPDYAVLFATLGGIALFGISGFVLGPVIAAMFLAGWKLFTQARASGDAGAVPGAAMVDDGLPLAAPPLAGSAVPPVATPTPADSPAPRPGTTGLTS